jgi:voltage-gated sodium channel
MIISRSSLSAPAGSPVRGGRQSMPPPVPRRLTTEHVVQHYEYKGQVKRCTGIFRWYLNCANVASRICDGEYQPIFQGIVVLNIAVAGLLVGLQTYPELGNHQGLNIGNDVVLGIFILEFLLKVLAEGDNPLRHFTGPEASWNIFDFAVIFLCMPFISDITGNNFPVVRLITRLFRLARITRLLHEVPTLRVLFEGLLSGIKAISYIFILLMLMFYLYAVVGVFLFKHSDPFYFRNIPIAMLSLFRATTLESWSVCMATTRLGCDKSSGNIYYTRPQLTAEEWSILPSMYKCEAPREFPVIGVVYWVSFIMVSAFIMLSLFIAVITINMQQTLDIMRQEVEEIAKRKLMLKKTKELVANVVEEEVEEEEQEEIEEDEDELEEEDEDSDEEEESNGGIEPASSADYQQEQQRNSSSEVVYVVSGDSDIHGRIPLVASDPTVLAAAGTTIHSPEEQRLALEHKLKMNASNDGSVNGSSVYNGSADNSSGTSHFTPQAAFRVNSRGSSFSASSDKDGAVSLALPGLGALSSKSAKSAKSAKAPKSLNSSKEASAKGASSAKVAPIVVSPRRKVIFGGAAGKHKGPVQNHKSRASFMMSIQEARKLKKMQEMKSLLMQAWSGTAAADDYHTALDQQQGIFLTLVRRSTLLSTAIIESPYFSNFIIVIILFTSILVGVQLDQNSQLSPESLKLMDAFQNFIFAVFALEVLLRMAAEEFNLLEYFSNVWNIFDFTVVALTEIPGAGARLVVILRLVRMLRVLKLVKSLPQLAVIVNALLIGLSSISYVGVLMFMLYYVFAIFGVLIFNHNDPFHFSTLHMALFTLFDIATLNNWGQIMFTAIYGCDKYPAFHQCNHPVAFGAGGAAYFCVFIVIGSFVMLTLFVGVVTTSMEEATKIQTLERAMESRALAICNANHITHKEMGIYRRVFAMLDLDGSGTIEAAELKIGLGCLGIRPTLEELEGWIIEVDINSDGVIDVVEFVTFMIAMKTRKMESAKADASGKMRRTRNDSSSSSSSSSASVLEPIMEEEEGEAEAETGRIDATAAAVHHVPTASGMDTVVPVTAVGARDSIAHAVPIVMEPAAAAAAAASHHDIFAPFNSSPSKHSHLLPLHHESFVDLSDLPHRVASPREGSSKDNSHMTSYRSANSSPAGTPRLLPAAVSHALEGNMDDSSSSKKNSARSQSSEICDSNFGTPNSVMSSSSPEGKHRRHGHTISGSHGHSHGHSHFSSPHHGHGGHHHHDGSGHKHSHHKDKEKEKDSHGHGHGHHHGHARPSFSNSITEGLAELTDMEFVHREPAKGFVAEVSELEHELGHTLSHSLHSLARMTHTATDSFTHMLATAASSANKVRRSSLALEGFGGGSGANSNKSSNKSNQSGRSVQSAKSVTSNQNGHLTHQDSIGDEDVEGIQAYAFEVEQSLKLGNANGNANATNNHIAANTSGTEVYVGGMNLSRDGGDATSDNNNSAANNGAASVKKDNNNNPSNGKNISGHNGTTSGRAKFRFLAV